MKYSKTLILLFLLAIGFSTTAQTTAVNYQTTPNSAAVFEENKGQMKDQHWQPRPDVLYYGKTGGLNYYIRNTGMSYQLTRVECWKEEDALHRMEPGSKKQVPDEIGTYRVDAEWLGHNTDYTVEKGCAIDGYNNYYNVPEGVQPALYVKQYEAVTLKNVWNGIDLHYYSTNGELETDYLVAPGADYRQIRMEIKGAELSVSPDGHLVMNTPFGEIREGTLKVYQADKLVAANWVIMGNIVSFDIPQFDPCLALRIDPLVRVWGTYYGGDFGDNGTDVVVDNYGNVYLTGSAMSSTSIASGGYQNIYSGSSDGFLVKFNATGLRLWSTYVGGSGYDVASAVVADSTNLFLLGFTTSTNGIALNGYQNTMAGGRDAFLAKFDFDGIREWGTYYGGDTLDDGFELAIDINSNVYIAGYTLSSTGIAMGGHQNTYGGSRDAFLTKFNNQGALLWSTYYGGVSAEIGHSVSIDNNGNVYLAGSTQSTSNISFGGHQNTKGANNSDDAFLVKFDANGSRIWATYYGGSGLEYGYDVTADAAGNIYLVGQTGSTSAIASNGHQNIPAGGTTFNFDAFLVKFNNNGVRQWGTYYGGTGNDVARSVVVDKNYNIYISGQTASTTAIASNGFQNINNGGMSDGDAFVVKFNSAGTRQWGTYYGGTGDEFGFLYKGPGREIYLYGHTNSATNISYRGHQNNFSTGGPSSNPEAYVVKFNDPLITGIVWQDLNANCIKETSENGYVNGVRFIIQPGNYIAESYDSIWYIDSLPAGTYTVTADTSNANWTLTCPITQTYTVTNPNGITAAPRFGFKAKYPCPKPDVSVTMPFMRRGFPNQPIYVKACNLALSTDSLLNSYVEVELDASISVQSGSLPYLNLGNNKYRINIGSLTLGQCVEFTLTATIGLSAVANQTLCMAAELFPQPVCIFDSIPHAFPQGSPVRACLLPYDDSKLKVSANCINDSVRLVVYNTAQSPLGNMKCFSPVRIFVDGVLSVDDSVKLNWGDSAVYKFAGNSQTWHIQTAQHPLNFLNEPYPIAAIELCGNGTWTPGIINTLPQADHLPTKDIYCAMVTAALDPNDKTGFPLGTGPLNDILPNQDMEYLIRFQNVGTDTAVNVIIRDTLSTNLDILSLRSGSSSHIYDFRIYGQRVVEWTFRNIMLPDSTSNEPASHGFVKFSVKQLPNLPLGTQIENTAAIYFDFEAPVITNTTFHTVESNPRSCIPTTSSFADTACGSYVWNGTTYTQSGTYTYQTTNVAGCDSTATLVLTVGGNTTSTTTQAACGSYTWNGTTYTQGGTYTYQTTNTAGCDSTATLVLTIGTNTTSTTTKTACGTYTWNGQTYTQSGTYTYQTTNAASCDSTATLVLTIGGNTTSNTTQSACGTYTWNGQTYTQSGTYTYQTTNAAGCDSTATLVLTIGGNTTSNTTQSACGTYTWNGQTYTQSGTYTYQTTNSAGCDSTATLVLTIGGNTTSTTTETACGTYTWNGQTYTQGGTYTFQTTNSAGCDSTATLVLTIETDFAGTDTIAGISVVDTTQTYTYSVPAGAAGDAFDWDITCGNITGGSGTNTISVIWNGPSNCGLSVVRSNAACTDTLAITVEIDFGSGIDNHIWSNLSLYPNPTDGIATITWGRSLDQQPNISLSDALGRQLNVPIQCLEQGCTIDTRGLPAGVYTVILRDADGNLVVRRLLKAGE